MLSVLPVLWIVTLAAILPRLLPVAAPTMSSAPGPPLTNLRPLATPAGEGSAEPHLAVAPDGGVWLSWLERRARGGQTLRGARLDGSRWSKAFTIAEGDSFFVNWADFPTLVPLGGGRLVAQYPWKTSEDTYAYDVRITASDDGGRTWEAPVVPHRDGTPTEHGFASLIPGPGGVRAVWLDGRNAVRDSAGHVIRLEEGAADMTLRTAVVATHGALADEALLDSRVCDCCQTAAVVTTQGALVAYRDRSNDEVRDIALVRLEGGRWSEPYPLHVDGWTIAGCPVNGPALTADGDRVAAAWYSGAGDSSRVLVAFSDDAGRRFGTPARVDGGDPLGRVHLTSLAGGDALVTWLELHGKEALVQVRHVGPKGPAGPAMTVARTASSRASGFPRVVRTGDRVVLAWTEVGSPSRVRTLVASIRASSRR